MLELSRLNVLQQAVSEKYLKDKKPTEQELRAEYETQVAALPRLEYHARHILVATEQFADKLVTELEKGAKFEDLAKRESMDSSKDNGGDLGWFTPDRMVKPFADAVMALKPGEYTHTPVQTQYGWHVIKLEETRDLAPPPFDSVKQRLEQMVQAKKFKAYVDDLMKTAKVEKKLEPAGRHTAGRGSRFVARLPRAPSQRAVARGGCRHAARLSLERTAASVSAAASCVGELNAVVQRVSRSRVRGQGSPQAALATAQGRRLLLDRGRPAGTAPTRSGINALSETPRFV